MAQTQTSADPAEPAAGQIAGSPTVQADAPAAAETSDSNLSEIVVTAQKRSERLQRVPIAVTAISSTVLTQAGLGLSEDLPRLTPGLTVNRNANFVGLFLRGVGTQFANPGLESSVATYQDDTYMPRTATAAFAFNDIERIEVLKGPQGTLYGRNAAAGAVRIITNDPKMGLWEGNASVQYGRYNRTGADAVINAPIGDSVALRISAMYDANDGYVTSINPTTPRLQSRNVWHVNGKLLWNATDNLSIKLSGDIGRKFDHEGQAFISIDSTCPGLIAACLGGRGGNGTLVSGQDGPARGDFPGSKFDTRDAGAALRADLTTGIGTVSSITTYRYYKFTGLADLDTANIPFQHALTDGENTKSYSQEFQLVSDNTKKLKYVFGLFYYKEKSGSNFSVSGIAINQQLGGPFTAVNGNVRTQPRLNALSDFDIESYAPYGEATYDFLDWLGLTVGLRYTSERKTQNSQDLRIIIPQAGVNVSAFGTPFGPREAKFDKLTPRVSINVKPSRDLLFYASFSRGFKSGGINSPDFARSPIILPEVLDSYELGAKTEFGNVRLNGSAFYYDYSNLQVTITSAQCGGSCVFNAANATIKGVEADTEWAPTSALNLGAGFSYLDTKFKNFAAGQSFVPASGTAACTAATATPNPADDGACLGYSLITKDQSGRPLPQAPKLTTYVRGSYTAELPNGAKLRFNALWNHTGRYFYGPDATFGIEPSKDLVSGAITFITADDFSLSVFGDNLLDDKYNTQFARQQTGGWTVPGMPRTWGVKLAKKF
ncbi:TonB-dependent receptor [Sphingomonas aliaeris]|uniref:TonB-dependent receptor n=1 Tax=Sphingomonas aliaeris TaxID=2759526 RepID=A0A974NVF1_9SPHN|nr:TonB-dependent receptor [Sphingomonas aliaeris]QQV77656.1 TonB-dependent receptor [Sphingomonas aliaeris]